MTALPPTAFPSITVGAHSIIGCERSQSELCACNSTALKNGWLTSLAIFGADNFRYRIVKAEANWSGRFWERLKSQIVSVRGLPIECEFVREGTFSLVELRDLLKECAYKTRHHNINPSFTVKTFFKRLDGCETIAQVAKVVEEFIN